ncbi:Calmodulin binding protein PICBP-like protein [Drosera capensis]
MKPPLQSHDTCKNKPTDPYKKMKKSRSFKRCDLEGHKTLRLHDEAPSVPRKGTLIGAAAPNYMKSTRNWEARKEGTRQASGQISPVEKGSNKLSSRMGHKLARTSSLDEQVRSLTKAPSFKPARKSQLLKSDAQKPTCSSTLKDCKFPPYLVLNQGGIKSEGTSVFKVCPYTYCSLNGHNHNDATPLKRFLAAKRWAMKSPKTMILEAEQVDHIVINSSSADDTNYMPDIFIQEKEVVKTADEDSWTSGSKVMTSAGEQKADEADFENKFGRETSEPNTIEDNLEEVKDIAPSYMNSSSSSEEDQDEVFSSIVAEEEAKNGSEPDRESSAGSSLDELSLSNLDMVWEEVQFSATQLEVWDISRENVNKCEDFHSRDSCTTKELFGELLKDIKADQLLLVSHDEVCQERLSDLDASIDGDNQDTVISSELQLEEAATVHRAAHGYSETKEAVNEDSKSREDATSIEDETLDQEQETKLLANPEANPRNVIEFSGYGKDSAETDSDEENKCIKPEIQDMKMDAKDGLEEKERVNEIVVQPEMAVEQKETIPDSSRMKENLPTENANAQEATENENVSVPGKTETSSIVEVEAEASPINNIPSLQETKEKKEHSDMYDALKRARCSKLQSEGDKEQKGFNPREPNYLPVEPDPGSEKVDLRHQEIDDRKDTNEWMLDYALQRAISKLAPARKTKVALMVAAFDTVIPVPRYETHSLRHGAAGIKTAAVSDILSVLASLPECIRSCSRGNNKRSIV